MAKWTREIAIRVSPGGKDHPNLAEYLARARKVAGTLVEQSDLAGRTFGRRYEAIDEDASVQVTYNNAVKNGVPQVNATINLTPPKTPASPPPPPPPKIEVPKSPPKEIASFKGTLTFFVGDETHSVYHPAIRDFTPTETYIADEAAFRSAVFPLIQRKEAYVGVINVETVSPDTYNVRPIPSYVGEYIASRTSSSFVEPEHYIAAIDQALATFPPEAIERRVITKAYFILDNSGSMLLTSIPLEVERHLRHKGISEITVESTPTERWMEFILNYFNSIQ